MKINYKLHIGGLIIIAVITITVFYYKTPWEVGLSRDVAEKRVKQVLIDSSVEPSVERKNEIILIPTARAAVGVAESILFEIYGKEKILSERPYGVHKIGDYWFISGSLPRFYDGGGFEIILDSKDSRVLSVRHYR